MQELIGKKVEPTYESCPYFGQVGEIKHVHPAAHNPYNHDLVTVDYGGEYYGEFLDNLKILY